jgi:urease accessory protein
LERSPIRIFVPRIDGASAVEEAVLVNTAGGIAGGDRLSYDVSAANDASITVTTQAAEKVYRALGRPARVETKLQVLDAARLAWLPQETIVFDSARLHRRIDVEITRGAELLALEWLVLGRAARGERMTSGFIADSWRIKNDGRLVWADTFRIADDVFPHLHEHALLANCSAIGTLICVAAGVETRLEPLREVVAGLACRCAITLVNGVLIVRLAAKESLLLRSALRNAIQHFTFRVPKMWSC